MSDFMEDKPDEDCCRSERIHVVIRSVTESLDLSTGGDWTIRQLKWTLSERLGGSAGQLVLIQNGRILRDSELMSHLKGENGSVSLCVIQRAQSASTQPACDPASESELIAVSELEQLPTPTSPLYLVEDLDSNADPGFFLSLQREMEGQLLCNPEMMQNTLSITSPQLIRRLTLSNPQIQQLLQMNPEMEDMQNNKDVINKVLGLIRNPDVIDGLVLEDNPSTTTATSGVLQKTEAKQPQSSLKTPQRKTSSVNHPEESLLAPVLSCDSTEPLRGLIAAPRTASSSQRTVTAGMQSVLEEITAHPGLVESLMSGPHASCVLNCLSQNPDLAAQMLLSHPIFSGNVQLQQQMRQQIPVFLQEMQSPEVLSAMLNPRVMEALLQIQQGLQILAAEAPSLIPLAELGTGGAGVNAASDAGLSGQSGCSDQVATVTEQQQQQQFVREMLEALANTNNQLCQEEAELQEELENSTGFRDRRRNF